MAAKLPKLYVNCGDWYWDLIYQSHYFPMHGWHKFQYVICAINYYPASQIPTLQSSNPTTTLAPVYMIAVTDCPFCIRFTFSSAKVENVVKPPQNPVAKISHVPSDICCLPINPNSKPISKQPKTLMMNVAV
jgi:hypothetical protein